MAERRTYSVVNMVWSILVVLAVVGVLVVFLPRSNKDAVHVVDIRQTVVAAQRVAPYHVKVPTGLGNDWRTTSTRLHTPQAAGDPVELHIGYYTPTENYAGVEQSNRRPYPFIRLQTSYGDIQGTRRVAGEIWDVYYSKGKNPPVRSLVRTFADGATVVVTGTSSYDELAELAASLR